MAKVPPLAALADVRARPGSTPDREPSHPPGYITDPTPLAGIRGGDGPADRCSAAVLARGHDDCAAPRSIGGGPAGAGQPIMSCVWGHIATMGQRQVAGGTRIGGGLALPSGAAAVSRMRGDPGGPASRGPGPPARCCRGGRPGVAVLRRGWRGPSRGPPARCAHGDCPGMVAPFAGARRNHVRDPGRSPTAPQSGLGVRGIGGQRGRVGSRERYLAVRCLSLRRAAPLQHQLALAATLRRLPWPSMGWRRRARRTVRRPSALVKGPSW
jgi:hypothetical protein